MSNQIKNPFSRNEDQQITYNIYNFLKNPTKENKKIVDGILNKYNLTNYFITLNDPRNHNGMIKVNKAYLNKQNDIENTFFYPVQNIIDETSKKITIEKQILGNIARFF